VLNSATGERTSTNDHGITDSSSTEPSAISVSEDSTHASDQHSSLGGTGYSGQPSAASRNPHVESSDSANIPVRGSTDPKTNPSSTYSGEAPHGGKRRSRDANEGIDAESSAGPEDLEHERVAQDLNTKDLQAPSSQTAAKDPLENLSDPSAEHADPDQVTRDGDQSTSTPNEATEAASNSESPQDQSAEHTQERNSPLPSNEGKDSSVDDLNNGEASVRLPYHN
jgi:hypothetical protein